MRDAPADLPALRDRAWAQLCRAAGDREHPARVCALATAGLTGGAEARMVVLRAARPGRATLAVQTDRASRKAAEIAADPRATLLFWHAPEALQIRARVRVRVVWGHALDALWARLSDAARQNYGGRPPPGAPLQDPRHRVPTVERDRFAILACRVRALDVVHLGDLHRRALFLRADGFAGGWLAP